ncbi:hypothetical protein ACKI1I_40795 [Streptomyces turgidiscabies]|uniref:Uncharacterized protein n=1 Tax=Streptomyces turgidiscabies (strain Car8) TaxID=698760 RepID=L7FHX1_STRT8|nr:MULTISPECIES: hypothetical protein [Streptomyces]ELP70641.1 hypothetical protein STRTUCAR8_03740 [Streptomyces turgidiscabies Car8]MDX3497151.1 hypothetical protein [Streptomyces turgidiscabies]GAQ68700.1 hypothetical protein T45_00415 [Streptomyces turgidiscabies]
MFVFVCAGCGAELTTPLSQVALPAHAHQKFGNGLQLPVLMEPGTFAEDPEPWGPPWRRWEEIQPDEAVARGVYAPVYALSDGAPGSIVIAPGDARGTVLIPEKAGGYCCGLGGADGLNMACEACGQPVASRIDDCSLWQAVWLAPDAVRRLTVGDADLAPLSWAELVKEGKSTPPFVPIATWGSRLGTNHFWSWNPQWEAAVGRALAHLLAASRGRPVTVPDGLSKEVFQRALDAMLPSGPPTRRAVLAGPGQPTPDPDGDIVLVPTHPQTGETWAPAGPDTTAYPVPLPFGVWLCLAFPKPHLPVPASGGMPDGVLRDDPLAPRPRYLFRADWGAFQHTLVRLPAVRSPWLREIPENHTQHMRAGLF